MLVQLTIAKYEERNVLFIKLNAVVKYSAYKTRTYPVYYKNYCILDSARMMNGKLPIFDKCSL